MTCLWHHGEAIQIAHGVAGGSVSKVANGLAGHLLLGYSWVMATECCDILQCETNV